MKFPVVVLLSIVFCGQACSDSQYQKSTFLGHWYFVGENEKVSTQDSLEITSRESSFFVAYRTGTSIFKGELTYTPNGKSIEGVLNGFGKVVLSMTESLSQFRNGSVSMDQANDFEDISIGFFQKKEVLEKLLKKKLPH